MAEVGEPTAGAARNAQSMLIGRLPKPAKTCDWAIGAQWENKYDQMKQLPKQLWQEPERIGTTVFAKRLGHTHKGSNDTWDEPASTFARFKNDCVVF